MHRLSGCLLPVALGLIIAGKACASDIVLSGSSWKIGISSSDGAITSIANTGERTFMNWVHADREWGVLVLGIGGSQVTLNHPASVTATDPHTVVTVYEEKGLSLTVTRSIGADDSFTESFVLKNTGSAEASFPANRTFLTVPFNDSYSAGAPACLAQNCNAHLWPGGASSWAHAVPMEGVGRCLGLVLTKGSFAGYSILGGANSNERGYLAFNPESFTLKPGEERRIEWKLFWDAGWQDFWAKALAQPGFVRLQAAHYTVIRGGTLEISARSSGSLDGAQLLQNGKVIATGGKDGVLEVKVPADQPGEQKFEIKQGDTVSRLNANVIEDPLKLIDARVRFIILHQQHNVPGDPLDGTYLAYDNVTGKQILDKNGDHNEARERIAMGVLIANYIPLCHDAALKEKLLASVGRYEAFIEREIQDPDGMVYDWAGYKNSVRLYNYPWVSQLHLAMYGATHDVKYLDLFVKTIRAYYSGNSAHGYRFYPLGLEVIDGLAALKKAGMQAEYGEILKDFTAHADSLAAIGANYPKSEVNYEQSIVGPGVQIELTAYLVTKDPKYLASARQQLKYLEAFNGQQPDHHLYDIGIRHWDDFWFGKIHLNGDTFPHYWTTSTALAFDEFAEATGDDTYRIRARDILLGNLSAFEADGSAHCAYMYQLMIGDQPGQRADPWANDQDWALINYLIVNGRQ